MADETRSSSKTSTKEADPGTELLGPDNPYIMGLESGVFMAPAPADPTDYSVSAGGGPPHPLPGTPGGPPFPEPKAA